MMTFLDKPKLYKSESGHFYKVIGYDVVPLYDSYMTNYLVEFMAGSKKKSDGELVRGVISEFSLHNLTEC